MKRAVPGIILIGVCLAACGRPDIDVTPQVIVSQEIPTVATVEWDVVTPGCVDAFVDFGPDKDLGLMARAYLDDAGHARATLLGMKPETAYQVRVAEVRSGERYYSSAFEVRTGTLPAASVELALSQVDEDRATRRFLATSLYSDRSTAVILDGDGDVVWSHTPPDLGWENAFVSRVRQARIGEWITYNVSGGQAHGLPEPDLTRAVVRVSLDGSREQVMLLPDTHHDFFELGDGSLALLRYDRREIDGIPWIGDAVVVIAPDGSERQVWTAWDHFPFDADHVVGPHRAWSHANALFFDMREGAYYVSLRNFDSIVKIDATSGEQLWALGGETSSFVLPGGSVDLFDNQHQFDLVDGGIVVFDNGSPEDLDSRAVEYALDETTGVVQRVWEHHSDPPLFCAAMGDVDRLDNGNTLITWSAAGQVEEVTPAGEVVWRLRAQIGAGFGFSLWRQTLTDTVHAELPIPDMGVLGGQDGGPGGRGAIGPGATATPVADPSPPPRS